MTRRTKAPAQPGIETPEQAIGAIAEWISESQRISLSKLALDEQIAIAKTAHDIIRASAGKRLKQLFASLQAAFETHRAEWLGSYKSTDLGGAKIGFRLSNPRLVVAAEDEDWIIQQLLDDPTTEHLVRIRYDLDKEAILTALAARLGALGLLRHQQEDFFIDAMPTRETAPVTQPTEEHAA